jgi:hypothetical protein
MPSKTSARRLIAAQRRANALELRLAGRTYREIGAALGCSSQRAFQLIDAELRHLNKRRQDSAEELRRLILERLDRLLVPQYEKAVAGDKEALQAVLSIEDRRIRLKGLVTDKHLVTAGMAPQQLTADELVSADRQLEEFERDLIRPQADGTLPDGNPQMSEIPGLLPPQSRADLRPDPTRLDPIPVVAGAGGNPANGAS